jgi:hypothetical protein
MNTEKDQAALPPEPPLSPEQIAQLKSELAEALGKLAALQKRDADWGLPPLTKS